MQQLYKLPGEDFWRLTTPDSITPKPTHDCQVVKFIPPESTKTYHWLIGSSGGLWRMTERRYAYINEVKKAFPTSSGNITRLEETVMTVYGYTPAPRDTYEDDRQIKHSGGCQGELD